LQRPAGRGLPVTCGRGLAAADGRARVWEGGRMDKVGPTEMRRWMGEARVTIVLSDLVSTVGHGVAGARLIG
jgi:hypothetical protein